MKWKMDSSAVYYIISAQESASLLLRSIGPTTILSLLHDITTDYSHLDVNREYRVKKSSRIKSDDV